MSARKMDSFLGKKLKLPQKVGPYSLFWPFLTAKSWLRVLLFLYPFRMFSTWLLSDVLATHVKCLSSAQSPPVSSRDTHCKLESYSLPGLHDLACLWLRSSHAFSASLAPSLALSRLGRPLPEGLCIYSSFACSALLELCLCFHCRAFPKYYLLEEAFPSHCLKWHVQILPTPPITLLFIVFFSL